MAAVGSSRRVLTVHVPHPYTSAPPLHSDEGFPNNAVHTTKYTWWNFVPKNLFAQFHRVANM
jgi:phospholipid-translocating ATPase